MSLGERLGTVSPENPFGPLHGRLQFEVFEGYSTIVGANNTGKSALLQLIFRGFHDATEYGGSRVCLIPPDRHGIASTLETGGATLESYNAQLRSRLGSGSSPSNLINNEAAWGENPALGRLLITHTDMYGQLGRASEILQHLGLPAVQVRAGQRINFADVEASFQGSGLRALYPIVAALTDDALRIILIDEPELSLEPQLQKALRDLLVTHAAFGPRAIVVATHSHLFLDRQTIGANHVVTQSGARTLGAQPVETEPELLDIVFRLLGNSTEDLFFPRNYIVVEGASDQAIVDRALELQGVAHGTIKVLSASGITEIESTVFAVERALLPMVVSDSPYAGRVVALIDGPSASEKSRTDKLKSHLGQRLVELPGPTLEHYIPEALYTAAGLAKETVLEQLEKATDFTATRELKRDISNKLAAAMTPELLDLMPEVKRLVELALL